jgi:hypothetical protein
MNNLSFCCPERCCIIKEDERKRSEELDVIMWRKKEEVDALGWNLLLIICEISVLMMISVVLNVLYQRGMKGWGKGIDYVKK